MPYANLTLDLTPAITTSVVAKIETIKTDLDGNLINLTNNEIASMYKMDTRRQSLVERGLIIATSNPTLVPAFANLAAAKQDKNRFDNLFTIKMQLVSLLQGIDHAMMASGSESLLFIRALYASLGAAAAQNVPGAKALYDELAEYFDLPSQPDAVPPAEPA